MKTKIYRKKSFLQWGLTLLMAGGIGVAQAQQEVSVDDYLQSYRPISQSNVAPMANATAAAQAKPTYPEPLPVVSPELAGETKGLFLWRLNQAMNAENGGFFVDGYVSQGISYGSNESEVYTPVAPNDQEGYEMNQLYLSFGKNVCQKGGWSFGFRTDLMYGTDYYYVSSLGLENRADNSPHWNKADGDASYRNAYSEYGVALPQAYAEIYCPYLNGSTLKVGHFYSVMGYESPMAPMNFFYSRSYSSLYGLPQTMSGAMFTGRLNQNWNVILGAVNEWNALDTVHDNASFVGGIQRNGDRVRFAATVMLGKQHAPGLQPLMLDDQSALTTIVNTYAQISLTQRLTYVVEFTGGWDDRDYHCYQKWVETGDCHKSGRSWLGLTNSFYYQMSSKFALGTRFEWFHDFDCSVIDSGFGYTYNDGDADYLILTVGANWKPCSWMTIRPEVRYDLSNYSDFDDYSYKTYDNYSKSYAVTAGGDIIIRF